MAHVQLDGTGTVTGVFKNPQDFTVEIADDDPRLITWTNVKLLLPQVDAFKQSRLAYGFNDPTTGKRFQCDAASQASLTALGASAGFGQMTSPQPQFPLITADNSIVTLSAADAFALINTRIMPWVSATVLYARGLKDAILAGNPPTDITQGWP